MGEKENRKLWRMKEKRKVAVPANLYVIFLIFPKRLRDVRKLPQVPSWQEAELGHFPLL